MSNEPAPRRRKLPPISFGPDALCIRLGKNGTFCIPWMDLGRILSDKDKVQAVTAHLLGDGRIGVSVDAVEPMQTFTQAEFLTLVRDHGTANRVH